MRHQQRIWALLVVLSVVISGCTLMGKKLPEPTVSHLRVSPAYILSGPQQKVKLQATAFDAHDMPVAAAIGAKVTASGFRTMAAGSPAATIHPDGTFEATQPGHYEITFTTPDGHATKRVPVTVIGTEESPLAQAVMAFTRAVETNDLATVHQYAGDSFLIYDAYFGAGEPESMDYFDEVVPRVTSWSIGGITVDRVDGMDTIMVSGKGELEVIHHGPDNQPFHTSIMAVTSFELVPSSPHPKIVSVRFEPLPPDISNGANVKAIVMAPASPTIRAGKYFEYRTGYHNVGGSGYYYMYITTTYNGHSGTARVTARDGISPVWVGANERNERSGISGMTYYDPGELIIQIEVVSGPTPANLQRTDYQELRFTVVP